MSNERNSSQLGRLFQSNRVASQSTFSEPNKKSPVAGLGGSVAALKTSTGMTLALTIDGTVDEVARFCPDDEGHSMSHRFTDSDEPPDELSGVLGEGWVTHLVEDRFVEDKLEEH